MSLTEEQDALPDPDRLIEEARMLLGSCDEYDIRPTGNDVKAVLRRAYQRFAGDLDALNRTVADPETLRAQLGFQIHEKLAAMLFFAQYTLLELSDPPQTCLDTNCARRDMTLYTDIFLRLDAVEALGALYDFAARQRHAATPEFWPNVCRHFLTLLVRLPDADEFLLAFFFQRLPARQLLVQMLQQAQPVEAAQLQMLLQESARPEDRQSPPPSLYMRMYQQYGELNYQGSEGYCALIAAQHRIQQAYAAGDLPMVKRWFMEGSACALQEVLRLAEIGLPAKRRARLLEEFLGLPDCDCARLATAVLELGTLNLSECPEGGQAEINRTLLNCAITDDAARTALAQVAVREFVTVCNQEALLFIAARAPLLSVAEEAVMAMCDLRQLRLVEPLLTARPALRPAFRAAHQHLVEIQSQVEAVWAAPSSELAEVHIERLKQLKAHPELDKITELMQKNRVVF